MISEFEHNLISRAQYEEDVQKLVRIAKGSKNPFFLFEYASAYNWDDGVSVADAIADNVHCDLGTALSLFWLAEALWYLTGESKRHEYNGEWADFCEKLISRIPNGFYKSGPVSFDPKVNRVQAYKLKKLGIPEIFYTPVCGVGTDQPPNKRL